MSFLIVFDLTYVILRQDLLAAPAENQHLVAELCVNEQCKKSIVAKFSNSIFKYFHSVDSGLKNIMC